MANDEMRIGDRERDEAIELLQEHMSSGRLTSDEFNERMSKALEAKIGKDLTALFTDLPGRRPGQPAAPVAPFGQPPVAAWNSPKPATYGEVIPETAIQHHQAAATPWYAQWWLMVVAIVLAMVSDGRVGLLVPAVAIWIWVIAPSLAKERERRQQAVAAPPRPLTFYEREELIAKINAGRPTSAVRRYRDLTGADLYTAKVTVEALKREIGR
jgi:hypothetical protein